MAELKLLIKNADGRKVVGKAQKEVELTDEIYESMSEANQLLVSLHDKFIGEVTHVGEYEGRYYVHSPIIAALRVVFKL